MRNTTVILDGKKYSNVKAAIATRNIPQIMWEKFKVDVGITNKDLESGEDISYYVERCLETLHSNRMRSLVGKKLFVRNHTFNNVKEIAIQYKLDEDSLLAAKSNQISQNPQASMTDFTEIVFQLSKVQATESVAPEKTTRRNKSLDDVIEGTSVSRRELQLFIIDHQYDTKRLDDQAIEIGVPSKEYKKERNKLLGQGEICLKQYSPMNRSEKLTDIEKQKLFDYYHNLEGEDDDEKVKNTSKEFKVSMRIVRTVVKEMELKHMNDDVIQEAIDVIEEPVKTEKQPVVVEPLLHLGNLKRERKPKPVPIPDEKVEEMEKKIDMKEFAKFYMLYGEEKAARRYFDDNIKKCHRKWLQFKDDYEISFTFTKL